MDNFEQYLATDQEAPLIKIAVAHYQFETIHPYRDGNGQLGRLLISLWLHRERIITAPMLFMSAYFEHNRDAYYDALLRVSTERRVERMDFVLPARRDHAVSRRNESQR